VLAVLVPVACLVAYGQALHGALFFDDVHNLLSNDLVQIRGSAFDGWRVAAISSDAGIFYRPIAMLSFAANYVVAGEFSALGLKATNLAIHLGVGAVVYLFALALLRAPALRAQQLDTRQRQLVAAIAASIWLLHPIHVSTVLYTVQRMTQLSALFTLSGLLVFTRYRLRWAETGAAPGEVVAAGLWLLLLSLFATLSKENGALLPWLIAVLEVTLFQGLWRGRSSRGLKRLGWIALVLPLLLVILIFVVNPDFFSGRFGGREFTLQERLFTQSRLLWQYLSWLALPNILSMGFFHDDIALSRSVWSPMTTGLSLIGWGLALGVALMAYKRYPLLAFAVLFYLVAHSMESTVLPLELVFEHRNYLPSVGFAVLAAVGIASIALHLQALRWCALLASILAVLVFLLMVRTQAWQDEMSLARFNVINHPQSARANFFYGNALFKRLQQAGNLGLDEDEKRALAVASRGYFERMHTLDEDNFGPLVMLYQLDTLSFPKLAAENDWLAKLETSADMRRLQSSDSTAMSALAEFAITPAAATGRARVGDLLHGVVARYPANMSLLAAQYRFLVEGGYDSRAPVQAALERAAEVNAHSPAAAAYLAQFHGTDNLPLTYEAIRTWLQRDQRRREIAAIQRIFDN
tara:strand:- start:254 stop:2164 length:1911 start_codon:yes stop_codon:yes gene_type:complete